MYDEDEGMMDDECVLMIGWKGKGAVRADTKHMIDCAMWSNLFFFL